MEALTLFQESLNWLKDNYHTFEFFMERDVVWTMQNHLREKIKALGLSYRVVNDWPMIKNSKRSLCADLVILNGDQIMLAAEFKYEPNHKRKLDYSENKLKANVVFWSGEHSVEEDIRRIKEFRSNEQCSADFVGVTIFIDEDGRFYNKQTNFPGSSWQQWNNSVAVLISWAKNDH